SLEARPGRRKAKRNAAVPAKICEENGRGTRGVKVTRVEETMGVETMLAEKAERIRRCSSPPDDAGEKSIDINAL
ncbi:MAG: hypothetical protein HUK20_09260, partial [Fibrobacter sp.]|nr:hypothetical protein [Fibrobacter sp.]